jgi:phage protein D
MKGKKLSQERLLCITNIEVDENCDGSDTLALTVEDPKYMYISDNIYIEDVKVHLSINWIGSSDKVTFDGYISAIDIDFPEDEGFPVMTINCVDRTHVMSRKKKSRTWKNVTNADVVRKIAKEHGFKCVVQKGYKFTKEETISQSNETDIDFLEGLADSEKYPFMCKLKDNVLYYVKRGLLAKSKHSLHYKEYPYNVLSFSPKINKETKQEEINSSKVNSKTKKTVKTKSTPTNTKTDTQGKKTRTSSKQTTEKGYTYSSKTGKWTEKNI